MKINRDICERSGCRHTRKFHNTLILCKRNGWFMEKEPSFWWVDGDMVPDDCDYKTEQAVSQ